MIAREDQPDLPSEREDQDTERTLKEPEDRPDILRRGNFLLELLIEAAGDLDKNIVQAISRCKFAFPESFL